QRIGLAAGFFVLIALSPIAFGIPLVLRKDMKLGIASTATSLMGAFYVGVSLSCLVWLRTEATNFLIIFILFSVWSGDIAAYYVGRSMGRHKLAPVVSPNKSWEGALASIAASVVVAIFVFHYAWQISGLFSRPWLNAHWVFPPSANLPFLIVPWAQVIILGAATNIAAQFGDLFESALKRSAGIKDSGTLLPGHGGILDRIDALLFAIPVVWYYAVFSDILQRSTIHPTF
ncbi:MAG TPA: phosphatidate cytidylyltransferase, partial [Candidatus Angelobacter sp.]|nr:phosphatidate cytidylyltransferase [Candidatus Angelobacter sp.]